MDPRWQATTHVQAPPPCPLSAVPEHLRTRLVEAVLEQVAGKHWSAARAAKELRAFGFATPSAAKIRAAIQCGIEGHEVAYGILVARLARPVGGLTRGSAA